MVLDDALTFIIDLVVWYILLIYLASLIDSFDLEGKVLGSSIMGNMGYERQV